MKGGWEYKMNEQKKIILGIERIGDIILGVVTPILLLIIIFIINSSDILKIISFLVVMFGTAAFVYSDYKRYNDRI